MVKSFPDQKEYLKKYLSGNKQKTKKKKSSKATSNGVKLIDDDEAIKSVDLDNEDLVLDGEDAPQIVLGEGVEPSSIQNSLKKWKSFTPAQTSTEKSKFLKKFSAIDLPRANENENAKEIRMSKEKEPPKASSNFNTNRSRRSTDDQSPPRKKEMDNTAMKSNSKTIDHSPRRKLKREENYPKDLQPQRSRSRWGKNDSPPRQNTVSNSTKRSSSSDLSPRRKKQSRNSPKRINSNDLSPRQKDENLQKRYKSKDLSPVRSRRVYDSPPRKYQRRHKDRSPSRKKKDNVNLSPKIKQNLSPIKDDFRHERNRNLSPSKSSYKFDKRNELDDERITKMADGKSAGLKNAKELKEELKEFREKEMEMLQKSHTGQFAEPIIRSNTRSKMETPDEKIANKRKEEENEKRREVYNRWGKGLKQIENHRTKIIEEEHESNKPLARYADDKDLDNMLKEVEREGDPMLEYLRNKKENDKVNKKQPQLPIYKGNYPENRFRIRPGYRWDGVDRSNGYEKKYFEKQNAKRALEEEAYRYSTEDM